MAEAPLPGESIDVGIAAIQGKVVLKWEAPTNLIVFDPQNAAQIAEQIAASAFEAFHGRPARNDISHLHAQMRNKVTEQVRVFLIKRVEVMLGSTRYSPRWPNEKLAAEIVDNILTKVA